MAYYETVHTEPGDMFPTVTAHETIDDAIAFADAHGIDYITEIGGNWEEFGKCAFCGEWRNYWELNKAGECELCEMTIKYHGG